MNELIHFNKAKQELALATNIDEIKEIRDKAEALRLYCKQAGESLEMQNNCAEIKIRAERRAGELLPNLIKVGNPQLSDDLIISKPLLLNDIGISLNQSSAYQQIATIPEDKFEEYIDIIKEQKEELTSAGTLRLAKEIQRQNRNDNMIPSSLPDGKYNVLYADPPWQYSDKLTDGYGASEHHYPSMSIQELCEMNIETISDINAVLFLWITSPLLEKAFEVINSWGFSYKSSFVWDKVKHNFGHYNSVRHEFLLICIKGSFLPQINELFDSVQSIERTKKHSEKPDDFRELIEKLYPAGKGIELFARTKEDKRNYGWRYWGNE